MVHEGGRRLSARETVHTKATAYALLCATGGCSAAGCRGFTAGTGGLLRGASSIGCISAAALSASGRLRLVLLRRRFFSASTSWLYATRSKMLFGATRPSVSPGRDAVRRGAGAERPAAGRGLTR